MHSIMHSIMPWVAVMGQDGSGKTSVLHALTLIFAPPVTAGVKVIHLRMDLVFKLKLTKGIPHYAKPLHSPFLSVLKLGALMLDWMLGYWGIVARQRAQGYLVIFDRHYLLDIQVDPRRYRYAGPSWLTRMVERLLPGPSVIILLDAPAEALQQRKQEIPVEESDRQRRAYLQLLRGQPNSYIVDCSRPLELVVADVKQIIANHLPHASQSAEAVDSVGEAGGAAEAG